MRRRAAGGKIPRMAGITDSIETNAGNPLEVENDGFRAKQHSLKDQIAADKHLKGEANADQIASGKLPIGLFKFKPPGSV